MQSNSIDEIYAIDEHLNDCHFEVTAIGDEASALLGILTDPFTNGQDITGEQADDICDYINTLGDRVDALLTLVNNIVDSIILRDDFLRDEEENQHG